VTSAVTPHERHTKAHPCPICGGWETIPRGQHRRCSGFTNGEWTRCTREEYAGSLPPEETGGGTAYRHKNVGECHCGVKHAPEPYRGPSDGPKSIEATYDYRDEQGELLFQVVRFCHKEFRQRKPDASRPDGWTWRLGDVRRVPYRLPELLASPPDATVYIVEGEKDVNTLARHGLVATCNPGGASKWHIVEATAAKALSQRNVVIVADRDDAGRKHANEVASHVRKVARSVELREAPEPHKDVTDLYNVGGTVEQLVPMSLPKPKPVPKPPPSKPKPAHDWERHLIYKVSKGQETDQLKENIANAATILAHDPQWKDVIAYDEFGEGIIKTKAPLWRSWDAPEGGDKPGDWSAVDTTRAVSWLSTWYKIDIGADSLSAAVRMVAERKRVHPVRDWLQSIRWDGKMRLPTWLIDIMGCPDSPYTRAVGQMWMVSAVARVYNPGCKVDTVLVLEGPPGIFKSSVLRALVGDEWFLEMGLSDVTNKDAMQVLRRKWIAEFPEIDGLSKNEQAHVKAFFSRQVDTYRPSYGRLSQDFPRQMVFAATTNKTDWLTDETGGTGRRMWPVRCSKGDVARAYAMRELLWAEATARFQSNETWHVQDPELRDQEKREQDARFRVDPWEPLVASWLLKHPDVGPPRAEIGVTTADVLRSALFVDVPKMGHAESIRVGAILRRLHWYPGNPENRDGARVRVYRPNANEFVGLDADEVPIIEPSIPALDYDDELSHGE
jgi:predicted P-loop ATPase